MNAAPLYCKFKLKIHVRTGAGRGWYGTYLVVATDLEDAEQIMKGFIGFDASDEVEIERAAQIESSLVGQPKSLSPVLGRIIYDEHSGTDLRYSVMRWPWSWLFKYKRYRVHKRYNRMLQHGVTNPDSSSGVDLGA